MTTLNILIVGALIPMGLVSVFKKEILEDMSKESVVIRDNQEYSFALLIIMVALLNWICVLMILVKLIIDLYYYIRNRI